MKTSLQQVKLRQLQNYASIAPSTYSASFVGWHHGKAASPLLSRSALHPDKHIYTYIHIHIYIYIYIYENTYIRTHTHTQTAWWWQRTLLRSCVGWAVGFRRLAELSSQGRSIVRPLLSFVGFSLLFLSSLRCNSCHGYLVASSVRSGTLTPLARWALFAYSLSLLAKCKASLRAPVMSGPWRRASSPQFYEAS